MAAPAMCYMPAVPPAMPGTMGMDLGMPGAPPSFQPPAMAEVNRQVYELPPQPSSGYVSDHQPGVVTLAQVNPGDAELLGFDATSQLPRAATNGSNSNYDNRGSPVSPFSGPPLDNQSATSVPKGRARSHSCASRQSDTSHGSLPFRHDPYSPDCEGEQSYAESFGKRTPSPCQNYFNSGSSFGNLEMSSPGYVVPPPTQQVFEYPPMPQQPMYVESLPPPPQPVHMIPQPQEAPSTGSDELTGSSEEEVTVQPERKKREAKKSVSAMTVRFKHGRQGEYYSDVGREVGTHVIIEGQRGQDLGIVTAVCIVDNKPRAERRRRRVRRDATEEEVAAWKGELFREEDAALSHMKAQVIKHRVPIVVHRAEFQFDRKKLTFHYTTKVAKPDFRAVLHDGFRQFKCRIWMNNCDPVSSEPGDRIDLNSELIPGVVKKPQSKRAAH